MNNAIKSANMKMGEQGSALIAAIMILAILSLLGAYATTVSNTESIITRNNVIYSQAFYSAEGLCIEGTALIEEDGDNWYGDPTSLPAGVVKSNSAQDMTKFSGWDFSTWTNCVKTAIYDLRPAGYSPYGSAPDKIDHIVYAIQDKGVAAGYDSSNPNYDIHDYDIYAMYDVKPGAGKTYPGRVLMAIGYKSKITK